MWPLVGGAVHSRGWGHERCPAPVVSTRPHPASIAAFSMAYADQSEKNHTALERAVRKGTVGSPFRKIADGILQAKAQGSVPEAFVRRLLLRRGGSCERQHEGSGRGTGSEAGDPGILHTRSGARRGARSIRLRDIGGDRSAGLVGDGPRCRAGRPPSSHSLAPALKNRRWGSLSK